MYLIRKEKSSVLKEFIKTHHYSRGCHNGPFGYGLYRDTTLIAAVAFATPCSENVRACLFGKEHKAHVTELHRLCTDGSLTSEFPLSKFLSGSLRQLSKDRPDLWGILSYADSTEGHHGGIYRACSFLYTGMSGGLSTFYIDGTGRLRHPRQCGVNINKDQAAERGWSPVKRGAKHRYVALLGTGREKKSRLSRLLLPVTKWET
jgi:hypothetical protein